MDYEYDMNQLQEAMLSATSLFRDGIIKTFADNEEPDSLVDTTLKKLVSYFSERSQAIVHLVSFEYTWDAEIVLRSAFETCAKIWFICLQTSANREIVVNEYWNIYSKIHNRKRLKKAHFSKSLFLSVKEKESSDVFSAFEDKSLFPHDDLNKKERKLIEQKWSFSEIISYLELSHPPDFPMKHVSSLLHGYGVASSLIHADDFALDLMLDRKLRNDQELLILMCAHTARIWSDLVTLWYILLAALGYRYDLNSISKDIAKAYMDYCCLRKPVEDRFNMSQKDFYDNFKK
ncbi:DUF5677 domain-containing protein [Solidesulfovibrio sp.]|uniref:DUF5677 domain-containing protein n=1 Tax=Solidesulfovibrio sp. TaxID=2910990 RepID=UPI002609B0A3|nr:DUF5677 domain-containing protein [Solidesulfovibrio sp.]